jgi:hypothetical protein
MGTPRGPIDDPCGYDAIRAAIARKSTPKSIYREFYGYYRDCLERGRTLALSLGSPPESQYRSGMIG